jgi:hypothetical protein
MCMTNSIGDKNRAILDNKVMICEVKCNFIFMLLQFIYDILK